MRRPVGYVTKRRRNATRENPKGQTVWIARLSYTDRETGRLVDRMRSALTKYEADQLLDELRAEYRKRGRIEVDKRSATFEDLAKAYEDSRVHPAEFQKGKKTSGLKSHYQVKLYLTVLRKHFKRKRVRELRHSDVLAFRRLRLKTPTRHDSERSIASVNRELETLRTLLRFGVREGYIEKSPFDEGDILIRKQHEQRRERVMSFEEEARLLDACTGRYEHLKALIVLAVDTGMRRGELFQLFWSDVDLDNGFITIRAEIEKANRGRRVALTSRSHDELVRLWAASDKRSDGLVFNITSTIKNGWKSICRIAGVSDLRFHDLRHTTVTRLIQSGVAPASVLKAIGHSTLSMLSRYLNPDENSLEKAAASLDKLLADQKKVAPKSLVH